MVAGIDPARSTGARLGARFRCVQTLFLGPLSEVIEIEGRRGELRAIKLLRRGHTCSARDARRLLQEGCVLAALDHPHLVKVFDVGITRDDRPYFIMERLFGETLRQRIERATRLDPALASRLAIEALRGLDAAHKAGVLHRDVKPSNIFLARSPAGDGDEVGERAVLLDFGVAKLYGSSDSTTATHILGTPRYMAPEQILGGHIDARTDVYSMGIVLFEAIAGRLPFDGETPIECMRAHIRNEPHSLSQFIEVSPTIERAVATAIQKMPDRRWPSAAAFVAALEEGSQAQ